MKTCLFCNNTRIFNIHNDYGNNNHTAKDDMLQFFGYQIENHLRPDDAICNLCMTIMDHVAKLKRRLLPLIFRSEYSPEEDIKPINFGKKWAFFASINFEDDPFFNNRSPTPSSLLKCQRVETYESPKEIKIAEIERYRSSSRQSSVRSDADSEVSRAFSRTRKRRKRGHNWTRRKNGRYSGLSVDTRRSASRTYSRQNSRISRPVSVMSVLSTESYESFYPPTSNVSEKSSKAQLKYDSNGCLQSKRTRSVARQQEEEIRMFFNDELHQCTEEGCSFICEDIDLMAQHKITKHKQLALFWCNFCGKQYTLSDDLEVHKRTHSEQYSCVICHREFFFDTDLLDHWNEHVRKSVPCIYCGKRFVDKNICNKHQKNVHKRKSPSRIDYEKSTEVTQKKSEDYQVRILLQDPPSSAEDN